MIRNDQNQLKMMTDNIIVKIGLTKKYYLQKLEMTQNDEIYFRNNMK